MEEQTAKVIDLQGYRERRQDDGRLGSVSERSAAHKPDKPVGLSRIVSLLGGFWPTWAFASPQQLSREDPGSEKNAG
ncbi:hypothetical protein ACQ3JU_0365 (plasmid) [Bradyrhizobium guangxiense]